MRCLFTVILAFLFCTACSTDNAPAEDRIINTIDTSAIIDTIDTSYDDLENLISESKNYLKEKDFDGDGLFDYLGFDYSGGAHCCYSMSLKLSSQQDTIHYPFEMDGGYGFGIVDGSNHDQFSIGDFDQDELPEIFMGISTYNGELNPIPSQWTSEYGFHSNYIIFDFLKDEIVISDYDSTVHQINRRAE